MRVLQLKNATRKSANAALANRAGEVVWSLSVSALAWLLNPVDAAALLRTGLAIVIGFLSVFAARVCWELLGEFGLQEENRRNVGGLIAVIALASVLLGWLVAGAPRFWESEPARLARRLSQIERGRLPIRLTTNEQNQLSYALQPGDEKRSVKLFSVKGDRDSKRLRDDFAAYFAIYDWPTISGEVDEAEPRITIIAKATDSMALRLREGLRELDIPSVLEPGSDDEITLIVGSRS